MLFDIIVFALTIYKATKVGYKVPLIQIVIRDGMCSDMAMCAVDYNGDWLHFQDHCTSCMIHQSYFRIVSKVTHRPFGLTAFCSSSTWPTY